MQSEINDDPDLLVSYFNTSTNNIYDDYKHLLSHHLSASTKEQILDKIAEVMNDHISCDIHKCTSYQHRHSQSVNQCISLMKADKLNNKNITSFCGEIMM